MTSKISWCDETINPLVGCGLNCDYCYARKMARRLAKMPHMTDRYAETIDDAGHWTGRTAWVPNERDKPFNWKRPRRIFWGSMGDIPANATQYQWARCLTAAASTRHHTHIFLTRDSSRMFELCRNYASYMATEFGLAYPVPSNVLLGTTITDQRDADKRLPPLMRLAGDGWRVWVSYEPATGPVDWAPWLERDCACDDNEKICPVCENYLILPGISWLVAGGMSGTDATPSHPDWFRAARDACESAGVPFHFKGWGEWGLTGEVSDRQRIVFNDGRHIECSTKAYDADLTRDWTQLRPTVVYRAGKAAAGRTLDGRTHDAGPV